MKEVTVTLRLDLDEEEQEKLAEYVALRREYDAACFPGRQYPKWRYTDEESLRHILSVIFLDDVRHLPEVISNIAFMVHCTF